LIRTTAAPWIVIWAVRCAVGLLGSAALAAANPAYLVVNGGNSPDSNYAWHERVITSFNQGLFRGKAQILNAGGPGTQYVKVDENGHVLRDRNGDAMFGSSELQGVRPESASRANILSVVEEIRRTEPSKVTVVYDDHGNRDGVSTWQSSNLTAGDIRNMTSVFPESTFFRSIHMHCNSGAAMVDPDRVLPTTLPAFREFSLKHYKANVCAVGMSDADELANYFSMERWPRNNWRQVFQRHPNLSLAQLKGVFRAEPDSKSTPLLTSDYFVRDLSAFLCGQQSAVALLPEADSGASGHGGDESLGAEAAELRISAAQQAALCNSASVRELEALTKTIANESAVYDDAKQVRRLASREYVQQKWPELVQAYNDAKARVRELRRAYVSDEAQAEIQALRSGPIAAYDLKIDNVDGTAGFKAHFKSFGIQWVGEHAEEYPALHASIFKLENRRKSVPELLRESDNAADEAKVARKRVARLAEAGQRAALTAWMNSGNASSWIKELYDGLQRCEASALY
jgi:hypothetical protein